MQRLEQQIGIILCQKQDRQKQLIEPGRQLLRHARQMLSVMMHSVRYRKAASAGGFGESGVVMGCMIDA